MGILHRRNLVIVGAGASFEFGLPIGSELKRQISSLVSFRQDNLGHIAGGNTVVRRAIQNMAAKKLLDIRDAYSACVQISKNMSTAHSIDSFIASHRENTALAVVAKMAIVCSILLAERRSTLYVSPDNTYNELNFGKIEDTWLAKYARMLITGRSLEEFLAALSQVTFLTFNYDRCIEHYFEWLVKVHYGAEKIALSDALLVHHVYGSVGELSAEGHGATPFGTEPDEHTIIRNFDKISTFHEEIQEGDVREVIDSALNPGGLLIFLGFAFLPMNMRFFEISEVELDRIVATSKGQSPDDIKFLKNEFRVLFPNGPEILFDSERCADLFDYYYRYLTRSTE